MLKWTSESIVGVAAIVVSGAGWIVTSAIHYGATDQQIKQVEINQQQMQATLDGNKQKLTDQQVHEAAVEQKLDDVVTALTNIEKKL